MAYTHWGVDELPWDRLDRTKVDPEHLLLVKAAALVEYNGHDYAAYLGNVFAGDQRIVTAAREWAEEEVQHGEALGRWAEAVDPTFDFQAAVVRFRAGYRLNLACDVSVRGSRSGELIARCIVETGTSSYYSALGEATDEPVLKAICRHITADEYRHYKMFYDFLRDYLQRESLGRLSRLKIGMGRIRESEDDELAYAYYAANAATGEPYDRKKYGQAYLGRAYKFYRPHHVKRGVGMIFKACGLKPHTPMQGMVNNAVWWMIKNKTKKLAKVA